MKAKKIFVGSSMLLALLISYSQVSADEVVTFGDEFENQNNSNVTEESFSDEDFGDTLIFNDPQKDISENPVTKNPVTENPVTENPFTENPVVTENPFENPQKNNFNDDNNTVVVVDDKNLNNKNSTVNQIKRSQPQKTQNKRLKTQKPRFIKLAIDDTYTYYLDKQSVAWQRVPYSAGEYMLDVWVRMIEINPDTSELPEDLAAYINNKHSGEIELAREKGLTFTPEDIKVLQNKKYFLEHYYLRPKTKQIQFLCELEVVGHPQNTVSERAYDYRNWENLIPGSIESIIYTNTIKEVGKSGSSEHGHMSFADMLEEYGRISIR